MSFSRTVAPSGSVLTLNEAKTQLKLDADITEDDAFIQALIDGATQYLDGIDGILNRALLTQTWQLKLDEFPRYNSMVSNVQRDVYAIKLPLPPLQSVSSVQYVDTAGVTQTWASSNYVVDTANEPGRIYPAYDKCYPSIRSQPEAVTITFVAGYGEAAAVPQPIKSAMLLLIRAWYDHRAAVGSSHITNKLPYGVDTLLASYKSYLPCY